MLRTPWIVAAAMLLLLGLVLSFAALPPARPPVTADRDQLAATGNSLPQGHVYTGIADEPDDVNPFTAHGATVRRYVLGLTHEGLLDTDPVTGELRPCLASEWELLAEPAGARFRLRDGLRFADGSPVARGDVMFGWQLARAGHLPLGYVGDAFHRVASAEWDGEGQLLVRFRDPAPGTLRAVAENWLVAKQGFFLAAVAQLAAQQGQPVPALDSKEFADLLRQIQRVPGPGTGPFQLPGDLAGPTTWQRRQELLLQRNEHHWRRFAEPGCWNLGGVRLLFRDRSVAQAELHARRIDWYFDPDCEGLLQRHPDLGEVYRPLVYDHPSLGIVSLVWNCRRPALADAAVRRALGHLFDRAAIQQLYRGKAAPAVALTKPSSPDHPHGLLPLPFDPPRVRALLREAGYAPELGRPLALRVLCAAGDPQLAAVQALLVDAAAQAGIELNCRELEFPAFVAQKVSGDWDGFLALRSLRPWGDPYEYVHRDGADNDGGFADAEVDRLATAVRRELAEPRRLELLRELHQRVHELQPFALLVHPQVAILFHKHLQQAVPGPRGLWPERFWMPVEWQRQ